MRLNLGGHHLLRQNQRGLHRVHHLNRHVVLGRVAHLAHDRQPCESDDLSLSVDILQVVGYGRLTWYPPHACVLGGVGHVEHCAGQRLNRGALIVGEGGIVSNR
jgi:hypothetical protein